MIKRGINLLGVKNKILLTTSAILRGKNITLVNQCGQILKDSRHKILMDWSPKSGCTIAVKCFFQHMGHLEKGLEYGPWIHDFRERRYYGEELTTLSDIQNPEYTFFKVTRNPYTRVVSSYINTRKFFKGHDPIKKILGASDISNITFNQFLTYLENENLQTCDHHFREQTKLYELENYRKPIICHLETLEESLQQLNQDHGFKLTAQGLGSHHHAKINSSNCTFSADLPLHQIENNTPPYESFYNNSIKKRVNNIYHRDIINYGYSFPWRNLTKTTAQNQTGNTQ